MWCGGRSWRRRAVGAPARGGGVVGAPARALPAVLEARPARAPPGSRPAGWVRSRLRRSLRRRGTHAGVRGWLLRVVSAHGWGSRRPRPWRIPNPAGPGRAPDQRGRVARLAGTGGPHRHRGRRAGQGHQEHPTSCSTRSAGGSSHDSNASYSASSPAPKSSLLGGIGETPRSVSPGMARARGYPNSRARWGSGQRIRRVCRGTGWVATASCAHRCICRGQLDGNRSEAGAGGAHLLVERVGLVAVAVDRRAKQPDSVGFELPRMSGNATFPLPGEADAARG